jgi:sialate O-acetylesterase
VGLINCSVTESAPIASWISAKGIYGVASADGSSHPDRSSIFDGLICPLLPFPITGAIWYQGEANAKPGSIPYDQTLPLMINDWRKRWQDDFSFYYVQLANFHAPSTEPGTPDPWPLLQDRMRRILNTTPKTGMAVINEVGEADDIHPKNKKAPARQNGGPR